MKFVTLAIVQLNRIGSATSTGYITGGPHVFHHEISDHDKEDLRQLVIATAESAGERAGSLANLVVEAPYQYGLGAEFTVFNIQGPRTSYGLPYAYCVVYPALKIGERYFKLQEIDISPIRQ